MYEKDEFSCVVTEELESGASMGVRCHIGHSHTILESLGLNPDSVLDSCYCATWKIPGSGSSGWVLADLS